MDRISVLGLSLSGGIGVYDHEKGVSQRVVIDVELSVESLSAAAAADDVKRTIDYDRVAAIARKVVAEKHHHLVETVAVSIADQVLALDPRIEGATVRVDKPSAVPDARTVRVEVNRVRRS